MDNVNYWQRRHARRTFLGGAGAAAGLALVGCGDDDKPKATPAKAATTTAPGGTAAATSAASPSPTLPAVGLGDLSKLSDEEFFARVPANPPKTWQDSDIKTGGTALRANNRPGHWDFITTSVGFPWDQITPVYSRLIRFRCAQGMKSALVPEIESDLATKWEKPDATTIVFTLAPNIKWQNKAPVNGRPFTAADVQYMLDRGKNYAGSIYKATYKAFDRAEDIGNNQVRIKLSQPDPLADQYLCAPWLSCVPKEYGDNPDQAKTTMVGTGGMLVDSFTPNVELVLKKNPDFFKKDAQGRQLPYIDGSRLQYFATADTIQQQFATGRVHYSYSEANIMGTSPFDAVRDFNKQFPKAMIQNLPAVAQTWTIIGNWGHRAMKDVRFRRAFNMLVPREAMMKQLYKGQASPAPYFPWPSIMDNNPKVSDLGPWYAYNPAEAKKLLEAAGFANETFDWEYYELGFPQAVPLIQQEAAQVGLKINLVKLDAQAWGAKLAQKNWKDFITQGRGIDFLDPFATTRAFVAGQDRNTAGIDDPTMNDLFTKLLPATGQARKDVGKQIWDRMLDQVYEVALPGGNRLSAMHPALKNYLDTGWAATTFGQGSIDSVWLDPTATL